MDLLKATSIPSSFIADEMDSCRSKRQILVLDCCHSGAFGRGTKGEQKAVTETTFEGSGFGRVVLTASDSTQYAFEGDQVIKQTDLSLFTHFLLEGLKTGEADVNNDGIISLDEWYDYTYTKVIAETPRQVPHKWSYNQQGDLIIARNPYVKKRVVELPYELVQALESSFVGIRESAVTELAKYLRSHDPEMVDLAISSLERMKGDDSRRISSLAERLLAEFEQARTPIIKRGTPLSKPIVEPEPETADVASESSLTVPIPTIETDSSLEAETRTSQPELEKSNIPVDRPSVAQELVFDSLFWAKWIGTAILAIVSSLAMYYYSIDQEDANIPIRMLSWVVTGLTSLVQWSLFRNRLEIWWIGANVAAGIVLGYLHKYLYEYFSNWGVEDVGMLLAVWMIGNFILGFVLIRASQQSSRKLTTILETGALQNIFLLLLSISLVLASIVSILLALELYDSIKPFWVLYGISAILVSLAFVLKKDIPRNVGFVSLAIFLFLDGINVERLAFNSEYPLFYFTANAVMALVSGIFFLSQRETWKNFGFILLSGYLIATGASNVVLYDTEVDRVLYLLAAIFALLAVVFFFLRKEQSSTLTT
jgi:hypothetical protein